MKVRIIDYGMGNLRSIGKACGKFCSDVKIINTNDDEFRLQLRSADAVILPGVGAFRDAIANLKKVSDDIIKHATEGGFLLGICLGFQLLFTESEEGGLFKGLNILEGRIVRFPDTVRIVPHMGWNSLEYHKPNHPLFKDIPEQSYVYFVHSYYAIPRDPDIIITLTDYEGIRFASTVGSGNVFATQYHPEKSSKVGLKILQNFFSLSRK
ncbi:MAG: imidazole glycerol phosphate synthase subunit HisH [Candidatus Helarchaeales archaeon]